MICIVDAIASLMVFCTVFTLLLVWIVVFINRKKADRSKSILVAFIGTCLGILSIYTTFLELSDPERIELREECYLQLISTPSEYQKRQSLIERNSPQPESKLEPEKPSHEAPKTVYYLVAKEGGTFNVENLNYKQVLEVPSSQCSQPIFAAHFLESTKEKQEMSTHPVELESTIPTYNQGIKELR